MTVHDPNSHQSFFEDSRGAEKIAAADCIEPLRQAETIVPGVMQVNTHVQYVIDDFSDRTITPNLYFRNFLNNKNVMSKKLAPVLLRNYTFSAIGNTSNFYNLPNSFKFASISNNHLLAGTDISTAQWNSVSQNSSFFGSYLFFNLNLTVKIEVFRGRMGNAKHDEESWSLLTKGDLQGQSGNLLCRMSYYDEKLTRNLNLPMLNKYFLINSGGAVSTGAQETVKRISRELLADAPSSWSEANNRAAAAYALSIGQDTKLTTSAATQTTTSPRTATTAATTTATRAVTATTTAATTTTTTSATTSTGTRTSGGGTY